MTATPPCNCLRCAIHYVIKENSPDGRGSPLPSAFVENTMSWTDERVELLKKMWGEGQSASQIAKFTEDIPRVVAGMFLVAAAPR